MTDRPLLLLGSFLIGSGTTQLFFAIVLQLETFSPGTALFLLLAGFGVVASWAVINQR